MDAEGRARLLAGRQDGVIEHRQLLRCGCSGSRVRRWARTGRLVRLHRGVFLIAGAPLTFRARVRAALLACGPGAFASHRTAAVLWHFRRREPEVIDVTVVGSSRRRLAGVRVHRLRGPATHQIRTRDGIRLSAPARTICELAASEPRDEVEHAIQEGAVRVRLTPPELECAATIWRPRPGSAMLAAILRAEAPNEFTRSSPERTLRRMIRDAGLPPPEASNYVVGDHRPDAVWPDRRLAVMIDGRETHATAVGFDRDRVETSELTAAGWRVLRFTPVQLRDRPLWLIAQIASALRGD